jgi:hypothetical protein
MHMCGEVYRDMEWMHNVGTYARSGTHVLQCLLETSRWAHNVIHSLLLLLLLNSYVSFLSYNDLDSAMRILNR